MVMENWKFLINRLIIFLGMIGSFMGATFGYSSLLIKIMGESMFLAPLAYIAIVSIIYVKSEDKAISKMVFFDTLIVLTTFMLIYLLLVVS